MYLWHNWSMPKISENELGISYIRSDGPGGQNVNKVSTAVQLRFDVAGSPSLTEDVKERLIKLAGRRMTKDGYLVIEARRFRAQEKNREDAIARFRALVEKAQMQPKSRKRTTPTRTSQERRLKEKKRKGEKKRMRSTRTTYDE